MLYQWAACEVVLEVDCSMRFLYLFVSHAHSSTWS